MKKPKPGWERLCEHANEVPNVCPCPETCGCRYYHCSPLKKDIDKLSVYGTKTVVPQSIPILYIEKYNYQLIEAAKLFKSGPMFEACLLRSEHVMDLVEAWQKSLK